MNKRAPVLFLIIVVERCPFTENLFIYLVGNKMYCEESKLQNCAPADKTIKPMKSAYKEIKDTYNAT